MLYCSFSTNQLNVLSGHSDGGLDAVSVSLGALPTSWTPAEMRICVCVCVQYQSMGAGGGAGKGCLSLVIRSHRLLARDPVPSNPSSSPISWQ